MLLRLKSCPAETCTYFFVLFSEKSDTLRRFKLPETECSNLVIKLQWLAQAGITQHILV